MMCGRSSLENGRTARGEKAQNRRFPGVGRPRFALQRAFPSSALLLLRERPFAGPQPGAARVDIARLLWLNVNEKFARSEIGLWIEANNADNTATS
jgi:hypothetical protein